jgi:hypothetical protein
MGTEAITSQIVSQLTTPQADAGSQAPEQATQSQGGDTDMANRLSILARKERGLLDKEKSIQQKLKEYEEKNARLSKYESFDTLDEEKAIQLLSQKGISLEKLQEKWLSQLNDDDLDPVQKQLKELRAQLSSKDDEMKKILNETLGERDKKEKETQLEQQSKQYHSELKKFIGENAEKYDLINTFGAADEVFQVIKDVYMKTSESGEPRLLSFDEASELYEKKLEESVGTWVKSGKVKKLIGLDPEEQIFASMSGQKTIDDTFTQSSGQSPELKTQAERDRAAAKLFESMIKGGAV